MRWALRSHSGLERANNEDYARALPELGLFVIADGMGGHVGGEVASRLAVDVFAEVVAAGAAGAEDESLLLAGAMFAAHEAVAEKAEELGLYGMGTTLTALRLRERTATIAHVGDSRAYLVHDRKLRALTKDHTVVALLVEHGTLRPEDAHRHPERHVLTQAVGPFAPIEPEVLRVEIPPDTRILLSTDGLHDVAEEPEIAELAALPELEQAAEELIACANRHGGPDNSTVILIEP